MTEEEKFKQLFMEEQKKSLYIHLSFSINDFNVGSSSYEIIFTRQALISILEKCLENGISIKEVEIIINKIGSSYQSFENIPFRKNFINIVSSGLFIQFKPHEKDRWGGNQKIRLYPSVLERGRRPKKEGEYNIFI